LKKGEGMKNQIKSFIIDTFMFGEGSLGDEEPLFDTGIIDSIGFIKLLAFIEKNFGASIDMSEVVMEKFNTLNNIAETVKSKIK